MAAIIELKYFNAFALKKIKKIVDVTPGTTGLITSGGATLTLDAIKTPATFRATGDGATYEFTINTYINFFLYIFFIN